MFSQVYYCNKSEGYLISISFCGVFNRDGDSEWESRLPSHSDSESASITVAVTANILKVRSRDKII